MVWIESVASFELKFVSNYFFKLYFICKLHKNSRIKLIVINDFEFFLYANYLWNILMTRFWILHFLFHFLQFSSPDVSTQQTALVWQECLLLLRGIVWGQRFAGRSLSARSPRWRADDAIHLSGVQSTVQNKNCTDDSSAETFSREGEQISYW